MAMTAQECKDMADKVQPLVKPMFKRYHKHGGYTGFVEVEQWQRLLMIVRSHNGFQWGRELPPSWSVCEYDGPGQAGETLRHCDTRKEAVGYASSVLTARFLAAGRQDD